MIETFLIGNLTKDPDVVKTTNGEICKFSVAVNKKQKKETQFYNVTCFGKMGENCVKFLKKGNKVAIKGEPNLREYEKDGVKKFAFEIVADEVEFLTPKKEDKDDEEIF